ncbi:restriction endonuclease subunit S [Sanguibacter sp. Z1732]
MAWATRKLGELTSKIGSGATPRGGSTVYRPSGTTFIRSQNVHDHKMRLEDVAYIDDDSAAALSSVAVSPGDVLINITGDSIARTSLVDLKALPARVSQHVAILRPTDELDSRYLQKFLTNPSFKDHLIAISSGGTRKALTKATLESLNIALPPLAVQRAIAEVLGALDDKIAANHQ